MTFMVMALGELGVIVSLLAPKVMKYEGLGAAASFQGLSLNDQTKKIKK